jgi:D-alanine-D-alanine ligase
MQIRGHYLSDADGTDHGIRRRKDTCMKKKKVVILHNQVTAESPKDELDVLVQVDAVFKALSELGYQPVTVPFSLAFEKTIKAIKKMSPLFVFNLVESVEGNGQLIHLAPALLDHLNMPYTGCSQEAIFVTSNKILSKKLLQLAGIASPPWLWAENPVESVALGAGTYLLKSVWEHASNWFDESSIAQVRNAVELRAILESKSQNGRGQFFAESYIEGREFNLAILAGTFLPVSEIHFVEYPDDKLKIVDFRAKWEEDSFEYTHTPRSFDFPETDQPLLSELLAIARRCWEFFDLRGYARVDFRVDKSGRPWVLEINSNPCLSPDGGFHAAAARMKLSFTDLVEKIIADCIGR